MGTHGPIDPVYRGMMEVLAGVIDEYFNGQRKPKQTGFCLLVFPFGEDPGERINYISNSERASMIEAMHELLDRFEGRHPEEKDTP